MRHLFLLATLLTLSASALGQSFPEVDALEDAFFAKDVATVAKHLPPELEKAILSLSPAKRALLAPELLVAEKMKREGGQITRLHEGAELLLLQYAEPRNFEIRLTLNRRISDGAETVLWIGDGEQSARDSRLQVYMRYVEGEWRVYELESPGLSIDFSDPARARRLRNPNAYNNESLATSKLESFHYAMRKYFMLKSGGNSEGEGDEAEIITPQLPAPPTEDSGYRFSFVSSSEDPPQYTAVARPTEYGTTGTRSFFLDESGVIRFTDEDREPTKEDTRLR